MAGTGYGRSFTPGCEVIAALAALMMFRRLAARSATHSFYFTVSTLTTTSVADPDLILQHGWMKVFAVFFQLAGIGVLVEILRRLGFGFIAARAAGEG
jgi:hypothetical protein